MDENDEEGGYFVDEDGEGDMQEVASDLEDLDLESQDEGEEGGEDVEVSEEAIAPLRDDASLCVSIHKGSVFSVSASPAGPLACSGGEDDQGVVWNLDNGDILFQCEGHNDSVTCTGFSRDGKYVATADMGGLVKVWVPSSGKLVWSFDTGGDVEWLKWHPLAQVLLLGDSSGTVWMWRIPSGDTKTFQGESSRNTCADLTSDGKRICCGYENGSVKVLDLKSGSSLMSLPGWLETDSAAEATARIANLGHSRAVTCVSAHSEGTLLLTGSEDGTSKLINSSNGKVLSVFQADFATDSSKNMEGEDEDAKDKNSVEAVCFSPTLPVAVTGSLSGIIGVWDISAQKLRQKCIQQSHYQSEPAGVVRLCCAREHPMVYSGGLDGVVRAWDLRSGQLEREWHGHRGSVLDLRLLQNEKGILSASDDGTVRLYSINSTNSIQ